MPESLSAEQARRLQLAAQGFAARRPGEDGKRVTRNHFRGVLDRLALVQLDSVNVIGRAHELAFFARLGPYDRSALGKWLHGSHDVFEYWGHAASFLPVDLYPALQFKRDKWRADMEKKQDAKMKRLRADTLATIADVGAVTFGELHDVMGEGPRRSGPWWGWTPLKRSLEGLFWSGQLGAVRNPRFERIYDLPERVLPPDVVKGPQLDEDAGRRELIRRAMAGLGVATVKDLAVYFYQLLGPVKKAVKAMVADGELLPVTVAGWVEEAYMAPGTKIPRRVTPRALLAPFDSLAFDRDRTSRVFDFDYKIEIYTPEPKRTYGYYVMPFLLGESFVGRVDLKADRKGKKLLVQSAWAELGADEFEVVEELADELRLIASWLTLDDVVVSSKGTLAKPLAKAFD